MRFRRLGLRAFGGFTATELDFSSTRGELELGETRPDFHLVFGANEAGKSTTLRAITGFLFGIPERSRDTYLHAKQLRISAEIDTSDGPLSLTRRKGRKATLLDADDQPVPETLLSGPLMGVDQQIYSALFGLDHMSLRAGGAAIARGEGQLGEALYAAGLGGSAVRSVLSKLREQADALYLPRGKRRINVLESRRKQAQDALNLATTPPESWKLQRAEVTRRELEVERLAGGRQELLREQSRLRGLSRVARVAARYHSARGELSQLGAVAALPPGFAEERERWMQQEGDARREVGRRQSEVEDLKRELGGLGEPQPIAELDSAELEVLRDRLGSHDKAVRDLPKRSAELRLVEEEIRQALQALRLLPGDGAELPGPALRTELLSLSADHSRLEAMLSGQLTSVAACEARLAVLSEDVADDVPHGNSEELAAALELAQRLGEPEQRLQQLAADERELSGRIAQLRGALGLLGVSARSLVLPSRERVRGFQASAEQRQGELLDQHRRVEALREQLEGIRQETLHIAESAGLPEPAALLAARQHRDLLWADLDDSLRRQQLPAGQAVRDFQLSLRAADSLADQLLGDAERVAQLDQLGRRARRLGVELERAEELAVELDRRAAAEQRAWEAEFAAARGVRPQALLTWHAELEALGQAEGEQERVVSEHAALAERVSALRARLGSALRGPEPPGPGQPAGSPALAEGVALQELLLIAQRRVKQLAAAEQRHSEQARRRAELTEQLAVQRASLSQTEARYAEWRGAWERALGRIGLPLDTPTSAVVATLEGLAQLETRLATQRQLESRVQGMQRDAAALARDLAQLLQRYAPDLADQDTAQAGAEFRRRYLAQRELAERRGHLLRRVAQLEGELAGAERAQREAQSELVQLCRVANVELPSQLAQAEKRSADYARLSQALAEHSRELLEAGQGLGPGVAESLDAILEAARAASPAEIELRLREIEAELPELDEAYRDAISGLEGSRQGLERLSTGSAATRGEELQEIVAELARELLAYRRVKLAELILAREIERYRRENQGPILSRANQLFPALTLGRYLGLGVGYNAEDQAILEALPSAPLGDIERVRADDLSDGARDQLYLALRIASIERYIETGARLPVVLDDILVHFDEQRARAALVALAELGQKTQVLFFTHHQRHVELAREALGPGQVKFHQLL